METPPINAFFWTRQMPRAARALDLDVETVNLCKAHADALTCARG
jgi:hypothetical protein